MISIAGCDKKNHYCPTKISNYFSVTLCNKGLQAKNILFKFMG